MLGKYLIIQVGFLLIFSACQPTRQVKVHSHNDYAQQNPFQNAYDNQIASIEIDIFLKDGILYVSHDKHEIVAENDIESMYLKPLQKEQNKSSLVIQELQLLIDFKSDAQNTLKEFMKVLTGYTELLQNNNISFVISGNRPPTQTYPDYPDYIMFDYQSLEEIQDPKIWKKIALISLPFAKYSKWSGKTKISDTGYKNLKTLVKKAHRYGKPFRLWGTPDTELVWTTLAELGVDYINTDMPTVCALFLKNQK